MRIPPLLADFIYNRGCELKCEKFLTRPFSGFTLFQRIKKLGLNSHSVIGVLTLVQV